MPKDTPFFKFDAKSWLAGSIQYCTLEEKGFFIDLCAHYWDKQKPIKIDDKFKVRYRNVEGTLSDLVGTLSNLEIIVESEAGITIPFLDELINERKQFLEKCSKAGKKSASLKGSSSNKKEESREKKEERRIKKVESIEIRKQSFQKSLNDAWQELKGTEYLPVNEVRNFFDYWTEHGDNDKKMRFEKEKSFGIKRRLATWKKNFEKYTPPQPQNQQPQLTPEEIAEKEAIEAEIKAIQEKLNYG